MCAWKIRNSLENWQGGVGTYVQEDNSVLVKSGTMGIGWGTLFPYMGHVMLSINEITWTGTLYTIAYWVIICTRSSWGKKNRHTPGSTQGS